MELALALRYLHLHELGVWSWIALLLGCGVLAAIVPYFWIRLPGTGYITGSESSHLLSGKYNTPTIHALVIVDGQITAEDIRGAIDRAGIPDKRFKRFACRLSSSYRRAARFDASIHWPPYFMRDPEFDMEHHVRVIRGGHTNESIQEYLSGIVNTPPTLDRPPWEILVSPRFNGTDSTAVVMRVHHVLADGLALVTFLDAITEPFETNDAQRSSLSAAMKVGMKRLVTLKWWERVGMYLYVLWKFAPEVNRGFIAPPNERNVFKKPLTGCKKVAWAFNVIDVPRLRKMKDVLGVKLNDIINAAATGALRKLAVEAGQKNGGAPPPETLRVYIPLSMRTDLKSLEDLNNQLSVLAVVLPTGLDHPKDRLRTVASEMDSVKASVVPLAQQMIWVPLGYTPKSILQANSDLVCDKATACFSNVPGPVHKRTLAGHRIDELLYWVPAVGSIGIVLCTITYNDRLSAGIVVDEAVPCPPERFIEAFTQALHEYDALASSTPTTES